MSGSESASSLRCPECGRAPMGNAPPGLCSYCLLVRALAVPDEAADFVSPDAKELNAEFADLEVRELLGRGGMGAVYLGWQKSLQRTVALKLLPRELLANEEFLERFQREGRVMAKLDHPNIARVFDAGITDSGWPYLLMELISGKPINVFVRERQLVLRQRLELFEAVCRAVQHAHQKGVIHRDLKPSNILVADTGDRPVPKVIDFGLARPAQESGADQAIWRSHTHAVGTPAYMSPEQAAGDSDLDTRTDVYSLGVLLYELLTGLVPFDTPDPSSVSVNEIQRLIRDTPIPKPSERLAASIQSIQPLTPALSPSDGADGEREKVSGAAGQSLLIQSSAPITSEASPAEAPNLHPRSLRGDLDCIALKALKKEREHRYESAAALAAEIARYLNHEPVLASPQTPLYRARKFTRRHRVSLSATAAMAIALLAATGVSMWQAVRASRAEEVTARRLYYAEMNGVLLDLKEGRGGRFEALRSRPGFVAAAEKFRGWEWHLADALSDRSIMSIQAHNGPASALAITPAGDRLASGGDDGVVRIWNAETGALLSSHAAGSPVRTLSWHPNGQVLAIGTSDGRLVAWSLPGDQPSHDSTVQRFNDSTVFELRAHKGAINTVTWTRDGRRFATAGDDANLVVWDAINQTEVVRFSHANAVLAAAWAPDGESIASACGSGCPGVQIWNVAERRLSHTLQDPFTVAVISLDWNPDGKQLAMGTAHWYVKVFDVETSKELFVRRLHRAPVGVVNWSADGQRLLTAADDGTLRVYHFDMGSTHTVLAGHSGPVRSAVWLNGSSGVASAGEDGSVRLWPAYDWTGSLVHFRCLPWASGLDFDPTGRLLAVTAGAEPVSVWDVQTGVRLHWLTGHLTPLRGLDWCPDGHLLAAGDAEGNIHVWNAHTGEGQTNLAIEGAVADLEWGPDGSRVLVLGENSSEARALSISDSSKAPPGVGLGQSSGALESVAETSSVRKRQRTGALQDAVAPATLSFRAGSTITAGGWSPDGRQIALGDDRGGLKILDAEDGRTLQTVRPGGKAMRRLSWGPDGNAIALGHEDGSLSAVELATGRALWTTIAHRGPVTEVCWHSRDRRIATGGQDGAVKLFDADSGEEIVVVKQNYSFVSALAWSTDGRKLAMGSHDYDLWVYDATTGMERNEPHRSRRDEAPPQIRNLKSEIRNEQSLLTSAAAAPFPGLSKGDALGLWETKFFLMRLWGLGPQDQNYDRSILLPRALRLLDWQIQRDPSACYLRQQRVWILFMQQRWAEAAAEARKILGLSAARHRDELAGRLAREALVESLHRTGAGSEALRVLGIPVRPTETPPRLIDLSDFYNASFDTSWLDPTSRASNSLASLPRGQQILQGVPFDLRGIVQLNNLPAGFARRVDGIPVGQPARRIHFLQAGAWLDSLPPAHVAKYIVRFDDAKEIDIPIHSGTHLDSWHVPAAGAGHRPDGPRIAWLGENPASHKHGNAIALYLFTWENPRPETVLSTISFLATDFDKHAAPFLVAITVE